MRADKLLRNFWVNLFAIFVGVLIGLLFPESARSLSIVGRLYLSLLTMTVLPIVFSAITHGIGQLLRSGNFSRSVGYLIVIFVGWVLLGALIGILSGTFGMAGAGLSESELHALGKLLMDDSGLLSQTKGSPGGLAGFLHQIIPRNVFLAFVSDQSLAVVFISILMGIALGINTSQASTRLLETVGGIYETFFRIMNWVLYGLPLGLCFLTAEHVAAAGTSILLILIKLILLLYAGCVILCLIYTVTMRLATGKSIGRILFSLKGPLLLSFVASNSLVAMPIAMQSLEENMDQSSEVVKVVIPLALAMNRHAYPLLFALATVYVSQAYGRPLGIDGLLMVSVASAFIGMAAVGPAASVAPMAAMIISFAGLPSQLGIVALVETTAVVTPMVAMTHLFGSCATTTILNSIQKRAEAPRGNREIPLTAD